MNAERQLVRALGTWGLAAGIVNVTVGGGIFRLPSAPDIAGRLGAAAPLAYVTCAIAMGLIVLCIAEAGSRVSLTGGPYAYVETAFGPFVGFLSGVLLWVTGTTALAAVATIFADNLAQLVPALAVTANRAVFIVFVFAVLAAINVRGVRQGAAVNSASTVIKLVPLVLLLVAGLFVIHPENLRITAMPAGSDLSRASIFLIFAFAGIESALVPSGEVKDPATTVPRAVFIAMAGVTVLYILLHMVAQGVLGPDLVGSTTPLADAAGRVFGPWGKTLLAVGVVLSTFGYLAGMTLAVPRALFAFGRDGFLPAKLAEVHPRFLTPWIAIIAQTVIVALLATTNGFERLAIIANVAALLVYFSCCVASWELRRRGIQGEGTPYRVPGGPLVPVLACLVIMLLLSSITAKEWSVLLGVLGVAAFIYLVTKSSRRAGTATADPSLRSG
ncbi:MAG: amino acid permease [Gemmatimonadetes bacterium]|nr:amino acid permease [Gemmatimonadota bacterium]